MHTLQGILDTYAKLPGPRKEIKGAYFTSRIQVNFKFYFTIYHVQFNGKIHFSPSKPDRTRWYPIFILWFCIPLKQPKWPYAPGDRNATIWELTASHKQVTQTRGKLYSNKQHFLYATVLPSRFNLSYSVSLRRSYHGYVSENLEKIFKW